MVDLLFCSVKTNQFCDPHGSRHTRGLRSVGGYNFNPRDPHGSRLCSTVYFLQLFPISIHATLTGRDFGIEQQTALDIEISIHATLTGRDVFVSFGSSDSRVNFNPRDPHGSRLNFILQTLHVRSYFNPRDPHGSRHI